jgi:segregation and condensation protein B
LGSSEGLSDLASRLECLLFVAGEPVPLKQLAAACGATDSATRESLGALAERLERDGALQLVEIAGGYQLSTKPEHAELITAFLSPRKRRLSRAVLETLAVVAYRQPVTLAEVEAVRGVNSDYSVHALVEMSLVEEVGRKETVGRPKLYGTTRQFLHQFNLGGLEDLPPVEAGEEKP